LENHFQNILSRLVVVFLSALTGIRQQGQKFPKRGQQKNRIVEKKSAVYS
jgi:hypothetical protein